MARLQVRELPLLRVAQPVLFPSIQAEVTLSSLSLPADIDRLQSYDGQVFLLAETAGAPAVGVVARIAQVKNQEADTLTITAAGLWRGVLLYEEKAEPFGVARVEFHPDESPSAEGRAAAKELREALAMVGSHLPPQFRRMLTRIQQVEEPGRMADLAMVWDGWSAQEKQTALDQIDLIARLQFVTELMRTQAERMSINNDLSEKVESSVRQRQREQLLREQMRAIQKELGESDESDLAELKRKVEATDFPPAARQVADRELKRLVGMGSQSPEAPMVRNYLEWLTCVPWKPTTTPTPDVEAAARILAEAHHGLDKVKERIIEYIAVRQLLTDLPSTNDGVPRAHTPILTLVGPPGVGKTSLGQAIAKATGRPFVRVSLGGVSDEAAIRGHRRTYIGSLPGRIIHGMRQAGATNPVFLLDEIDKVGVSYRGDVSSALLEVLDPEQNHTFVDHYLEVPYDLSQVLFITTANVLDTLPAPLLDRLEIIEVPGYTEDEKLGIARSHLLTKQVAAHGLPADSLGLADEVLLAIIRGYTMESGVRQLERELGNLARKRARRYAAGEKEPIAVTQGDLSDWLGKIKVRPPKARTVDEVGVATGVAYTGRGGDTLLIEVALMPGKGELLITGQLGDVMQESARAAFSVVKGRAAAWGIDPEVFATTQVHLHVPAGAVPKDGPSAGITIATALLSAFTGRPVRHDVAMTGEITLRGRVMPIGGLKEKTLAALRAGATRFILPEDNALDLTDISPAAMAGLTFTQVADVAEVWAVALAQLEPAGTKPTPSFAGDPLPTAGSIGSMN